MSGDKYDGYKPMVWIKKQTRNQKPSKASVIDFLYLLGIKQENINPKRLNCCFICSDDNSYSPFGYNNINTKKSEFHEILKEIIELVFFKNHVILQFVGKEENNTDSKPSKQ